MLLDESPGQETSKRSAENAKLVPKMAKMKNWKVTYKGAKTGGKLEHSFAILKKRFYCYMVNVNESVTKKSSTLQLRRGK